MDTEQLIAIRRDLHKIPEIGFQEFETQKYILNILSRYPSERVEIKTWKTGIFVKIAGTSPKKVIGYRADMDGLSITEETSYDFSSIHEGKMHACGHDLHMTIALGLVDWFVGNPVKDDLLFLFQPAEEGPGGAKPMLDSKVMEEWKPDMIMALHIAPELPVGTIATRSGLLFANTSELVIDFNGKGGHAAFPHLSQDMVVAASSFVTQLQSIISRNVDPLDSAVITIGTIRGGSAQNIIAEKARLEGTIRTLSVPAMAEVKKRIETMAKGTGISYQCDVNVSYPAAYRQVFNDDQYVRDFMSFVSDEGLADVRVCAPAMTGEDFGYMVEQIPGFMFWLGVDSSYGLHHSKLKPDERAIENAVDIVKQYLSRTANN
ncbi:MULTISPECIES: N-acetyldiaminopimelate deacetylase [Bacillus]|uniref:N-acetyldiaminopimelate deacetylase n=2 Tax=Bacillus TaxID=1386 RepID=A0A0M4G7A5_9BACI|nr:MULTISPECIES: N-acetyldiaminopimelate deacetylase [Bacillus]ALC80890.1 N-acetyldiaminopimelate deacetylase [Bacillus gobiensis]MBP1079831.1 N-acetyldiaminopimelate deacetylase [Bacillus capparidis]MED1095220.1 N-acetyldiaminopimelate deacetylase [Bacillus capparidis]